MRNSFFSGLLVSFAALHLLFLLSHRNIIVAHALDVILLKPNETRYDLRYDYVFADVIPFDSIGTDMLQPALVHFEASRISWYADTILETSQIFSIFLFAFDDGIGKRSMSMVMLQLIPKTPIPEYGHVELSIVEEREQLFLLIQYMLGKDKLRLHEGRVGTRQKILLKDKEVSFIDSQNKEVSFIDSHNRRLTGNALITFIEKHLKSEWGEGKSNTYFGKRLVSQFSEMMDAAQRQYMNFRGRRCRNPNSGDDAVQMLTWLGELTTKQADIRKLEDMSGHLIRWKAERSLPPETVYADMNRDADYLETETLQYAASAAAA